MKDGSSLVVTLSSIPSSATRGLDADLSSEESKDILEDPEDEPVLKKRISNSDEEESTPLKTEFMGMCFFVSFIPHFFFTHMYLRCSLLRSPFHLYVCFPICKDL